ncbi:MAG TPA: 50S ribosomal protein L37e [Nitrososphaerales archaeon]|nr:50S ribosomal protein L37e [Nitrososphaerales archaeon]
MTKGTSSMGNFTRGKVHIKCRRCGNNSYHLRRKHCSNCGYPNPRMRKYAFIRSK